MSCNCKRDLVKTIGDELNFNHESKPRKGVGRFFNMIWDTIKTVLFRLLVIGLVIIILPIVFVVILINILFGGQGRIKLPKKMISYFARKQKRENGE